jgi:acetyl esterase
VQVLDHERWSWFLLASGADLLLDVHVSHGPVSWSLTIALDDAERDALRREGRTYLSRLAEEIQESAPISAGSSSPYRARDLSRTQGDAVTQAVVAWRESGAESVDVGRLRHDAHERALARPRRPFAGTVVDQTADEVRMRRYVPDAGADGTAVVFLHGGYGLFGDLEMQDGYCRTLAGALGVVVLSVDYRRAPEATLDDAAADALTGLARLTADGFTRLFLCGDSAGGTVATLAAARSQVAGLLLTNPNLDLTLTSFDDARPGGPDRDLSAFSFRAWARVTDLADAPRLDRLAGRLPPTVVAVGTLDSLLPEARGLAEACERAGVACRLVELDGAEHGFVGTDRVDEALVAFRSLVDG